MVMVVVRKGTRSFRDLGLGGRLILVANYYGFRQLLSLKFST